MLSHVFLGVSDFDRALDFYRAVLGVLGVQERFCEPERPWAGWQSTPGPRPLLLIGHPFAGEHAPGNGQMVALLASSRALVRRTYACALAQGARCEGAPGARPEYHPHYYGAYFRDPDGNKLAVACHEPDMDPPTLPFAEVLLTLAPVEHLAALELLDDAGQVLARLENRPGQSGALRVYAALAQRHDGSIDASAAEEGLALFAEHTAAARLHPGSHPNIDRLLALQHQEQCWKVRLVPRAPSDGATAPI